MHLLEKLAKLKDFFITGRAESGDIQSIDTWIYTAKRLLLIKSLKDHDGIRYVLEIFQGEVEKINQQLAGAYSKDLPDYERDRLLDRRDLAQKYLNLFSETDSKLENLEEIVDQEMID